MIDLKKFKSDLSGIDEWLRKEYATLRTGKATPIILDGVMVENYGQRMKINQVAGVTMEDARTLRVVPWDKSKRQL